MVLFGAVTTREPSLIQHNSVHQITGLCRVKIASEAVRDRTSATVIVDKPVSNIKYLNNN